MKLPHLKLLPYLGPFESCERTLWYMHTVRCFCEVCKSKSLLLQSARWLSLSTPVLPLTVPPCGAGEWWRGQLCGIGFGEFRPGIHSVSLLWNMFMAVPSLPYIVELPWNRKSFPRVCIMSSIKNVIFNTNDTRKREMSSNLIAHIANG